MTVAPTATRPARLLDVPSVLRRWTRSPALAGTLAVLRLLPTVSRARTLLLTASVLASALLPVGLTIVTGLLIGSIPNAVQTGLDSPAGRATLDLLAVAGLLVVAMRLIGPFQDALATTFGRDVDRHLQERVMAAVSGPSGVAHLEDTSTLDLIRNAQGVGMEGLRPGEAVRALASLLPSWLQALGSALVLATFHWWLGVLWLALWPVVLVVLQGEFIRVGKAAGVQAAVVRRAEYFLDLALSPAAAKELRIWGMLDWLTARFDAAWHDAMLPVWRTRRPSRPILWLATGVVAATNLGSYALLAWSAVRGDLTLAALAIYSRALLDASVFRAFDDPNAHLAYAAVAVPSLLELERRLATPAEPSAEGPHFQVTSDRQTPLPTRKRVPAPRRGEARPLPPREAVRFEGVTFRYPDQPTDVLAGLDLVIPAGRSLAVVGANGAGKTTLVKLLCRLYEPTGGRIAVDGVELAGTDPCAWQRSIAAIFQDFVRYHLTARDNVGLGAPHLLARPDADERLRAAAAKAGARDLIEALPRGWDTILSRQYTGGTDLSGGQWQRIALARAIFAVEGGARVLILDEPTANLDVRAEAALYDRFLEITAGLTTVLISHRFSTVRRADRICVLEDGRIAEQGTHDELIALGGRYARLFALQATRFADDATVDATDDIIAAGDGAEEAGRDE